MKQLIAEELTAEELAVEVKQRSQELDEAISMDYISDTEEDGWKSADVPLSTIPSNLQAQEAYVRRKL